MIAGPDRESLREVGSMCLLSGNRTFGSARLERHGPSGSSFILAAWLAVALVGLPAPAASDTQEPALEEVSQRLSTLEQQVESFRDRASFLVEQFGRDVDLTVGEFERRFSEAEIQFLLEDYAAAIVYLYDIVDTPRFQDMDRYDDALYYLAESLYQQESWIPSRGFFLDLIDRGPTRHDDHALLRLIEISGRIGDYSDVEDHYQRLAQSGRPMRPEVRYVWGKFIFDRDDLDDQARWMRARDAFEQVPLDSPYGLAARYFVGVVHVQEARKGWEEAEVRHRANPEALERAEERFHQELEPGILAFLQVVSESAESERRRLVQEQAWLALGRAYIEVGRYEEAIDAYQRIHRHSDHYYQALYEIAWAFVKNGDLDNARRAAEILLAGASDSVLAPEIRLLLGHLHARAQRYERATDAYDEVIIEYSPVRDDLDALLDLHEDPVEYFSEVIVDEGADFDVEDILPPAAARRASTQQEVERGFSIASDLDEGRTSIGESRQIAERILASLDGGTLEPFPTLAEGHRLSTETHSRMLGARTELSELEHDLVSSRIPASIQAAYERAREERERAEARYRSLPATPEQMEERRERWLETVERVHREAFRARMEAQSQAAQIVAMRRLLRDRRDELRAKPGVLDAFLARLDREKDEVDRLEARADMLMRELDRLADAVRADTAVTGAREAVVEYERALEAERELLSSVRDTVGAKDAELTRLDGLRTDLIASTEKVTELLEDIERRGAVRRQVLRDQVMSEISRLEVYTEDMAAVGVDTRELVGRIALDSVRAVRQEFYDLILRSDVGIIDVAWAKKSDRSREIQNLVQEQSEQIEALQRDFEEVMHDPHEESGR